MTTEVQKCEVELSNGEDCEETKSHIHCDICTRALFPNETVSKDEALETHRNLTHAKNVNASEL
jgi:hypothetical protein